MHLRMPLLAWWMLLTMTRGSANPGGQLSYISEGGKKKVAKPEIMSDVGEGACGQLQPIAVSMLMRLLYGARYAKFDWSKLFLRLASLLSYWDFDCNTRLMCLLSYVEISLQRRLVRWFATGSMMCSLMLVLIQFSGNPSSNCHREAFWSPFVRFLLTLRTLLVTSDRNSR